MGERLRFLQTPMSSKHPDSPDSHAPDEKGAMTSKSAASQGAPNQQIRHSTASKSSTQLLRLWLMANTLGFAVATVLTVSIGFVFPSREIFVAGLFVSVVAGSMQAIVLRQKVARLKVWQWLFASILSSYVGIFLATLTTFLMGTFGLFILVLIPFSDIFVAAVFGAVIGTCIGVGQILVLAKHVRGLYRWWVAHVIGRSLGWLMAYLLWKLVQGRSAIVEFPNNLTDILVVMVCSAFGGLVYGGVTAIAWPRLTPRQPSTHAH